MACVIRSLIFYLVFYGGSAIWAFFAGAATIIGPRTLRVVTDKWTAFHLACTRYILGIDVRFEGGPIDQPAIYAIKHESFFEAISLPVIFDYPSAFAKHELFQIPLWGKAAGVYGMIPVAREDGAKALRTMISMARKRSAEGRPLVIFPEGTRVPHGQRPALRSGFAGLYKMMKLPVVPVAVDSGLFYQGRWKKSGTITIRFGETIEPGLPREEIEKRVHHAINALN